MSPADAALAGPGRWRPILLSVLVHAAIIGLLGWSWWRQRAPRPAPRQLAIEATVVMEKPATPAPAPATAAPPPAQPDAAESEMNMQEERRQQQAAAQREAQQHAEEQARLEREAQQREQRLQRERAAAELKRRQEAAASKAREQAQRAAQDKARREAELRTQLAAEERINAARSSAAAAAWLSLIRDRVTNAWVRPPTARAGLNCEVHVTQVPGGTVTAVQIGSCNGDAAVRESIETAVYRASPLPSPSNPDLFDRNLTFIFHPDE